MGTEERHGVEEKREEDEDCCLRIQSLRGNDVLAVVFLSHKAKHLQTGSLLVCARECNCIFHPSARQAAHSNGSADRSKKNFKRDFL